MISSFIKWEQNALKHPVIEWLSQIIYLACLACTARDLHKINKFLIIIVVMMLIKTTELIIIDPNYKDRWQNESWQAYWDLRMHP